MEENQSPVGYDTFVRKLFNRSSDASKDFTHAILGIATEVYEYQCATDEVNALEELGDLEFYVEALSQVIVDHLKTTNFEIPDPAHSLQALVAASKATCVEYVTTHLVNQLLDEAKRWVGYGKEPSDLPGTWSAVHALVIFVNLFGKYPHRDGDRIKAANMAKLLKRYPGGEFDAYRAIVRDLQGERDVLQAS